MPTITHQIPIFHQSDTIQKEIQYNLVLKFKKEISKSETVAKKILPFTDAICN